MGCWAAMASMASLMYTKARRPFPSHACDARASQCLGRLKLARRPWVPVDWTLNTAPHHSEPTLKPTFCEWHASFLRGVTLFCLFAANRPTLDEIKTPQNEEAFSCSQFVGHVATYIQVCTVAWRVYVESDLETPQGLESNQESTYRLAARHPQNIPKPWRKTHVPHTS